MFLRRVSIIAFVPPESPVKDVVAWPKRLLMPLSKPLAASPIPLDKDEVNPLKTPLVD